MTDVGLNLYLLIGFGILASIVAVEARGLLSTVISVSAAGLALSVIFLLLSAPDLAITQVVVEVVCLVLLIRAAVVREDTTLGIARNRFAVAVGLIFVGVLVCVSYVTFSSMEPFGNPLMAQTQARELIAAEAENAAPGELLAPDRPIGLAYLENGLEKTGAANYVTAVLLDFRAYDTLGEATVIFAAIIGAYALLRKVGRLPHEGHDADR